MPVPWGSPAQNAHTSEPPLIPGLIGSAPIAASRTQNSCRQPVAAPAAQSFGLAMFAHLAILLGFLIPFLNIIVPFVIWRMKSGEDEFAVGCAKEAINSQISILLWWLALVAFALLCVAIFPPFVISAGLIGVVLLFANLILPVIAAAKASSGESYYYPRTWHIFE